MIRGEDGEELEELEEEGDLLDREAEKQRSRGGVDECGHSGSPAVGHSVSTSISKPAST